MYAISGADVYLFNDVDVLQCFDNHIGVFSDFPKLNLTYDEPMRKDLTLYEKLNISFSSTNFSPISYSDIRKRYPAWKLTKIMIVMVTVFIIIRSVAFDTPWLT